MTSEIARREPGETSPLAFDWTALADSFADPVYFSTLWELDPFELKRQATALEENSEHLLATIYAGLLDDPSTGVAFGRGLGLLLRYRGLGALADAVQGAALEHARRSDDLAMLQEALGDAVRGGLVDDVISGLLERELVCRHIGDAHGLQEALHGQAMVHALRSYYDVPDVDDPEGRDDATLIDEQYRVCRKSGDLRGLQVWMGARQDTAEVDGDHELAIRLNALRERVCRRIGELDGLIDCLLDRLEWVRAAHDFTAADELLAEVDTIAHDLGRARAVRHVLCDRGTLAIMRGDLDLALRFFREQDDMVRRFGWPSDLDDWLFDHPMWHRFTRDSDELLAFLLSAEVIARDLEVHDVLEECLGGLVEVLAERDTDGALGRAEERLALCRSMPERKYSMQEALGDLARLLVPHGELHRAQALCREREAVLREAKSLDWCREAAWREHLLIITAQLGKCGDLDEALDLCAEQERLCVALKDRRGTRRARAQAARLARLPGRKREESLPTPGQLLLFS